MMEAEGTDGLREGAEVKIAEGKQFNKGRAWREASLGVSRNIRGECRRAAGKTPTETTGPPAGPS